MIPIECPRCGKTGHVPPDRLGSRLVCKRCESVFHMDKGGRMILGELGASASQKTAKLRLSFPTPEIDLSQTWRDVPKPAKFAVPTAFVLLSSWMLFPASSPSFDYHDQAKVIAEALLHGERSKVVELATSASAEAASKWYDLLSAPIAKKGAGSSSDNAVRTALMTGNPDRDSLLNMAVTITIDTMTTTLSLNMVNERGHWKLDATSSLDEAQRAASTIKVVNKVTNPKKK